MQEFYGFLNLHLKRPVRFNLLAGVSRLNDPLPPDHGQTRFQIAKRLLGREPVVVFHPWNPSQVIYVEGEPDDWREFLEQKIEEGKLDEVLKAAAIEGRAN